LKLPQEIRMFGAFVTGSRVYGEPTYDSDVDLVVLVDEPTLELLLAVINEQRGMQAEATASATDNPEALSASLNFGCLNLLCVTSPIAYGIWKLGTEKLTELAPVPRNDAVAYFKALRAHYAIAKKVPAAADFIALRGQVEPPT
jgi:hypothetical protein